MELTNNKKILQDRLDEIISNFPEKRNLKNPTLKRTYTPLRNLFDNCIGYARKHLEKNELAPAQMHMLDAKKIYNYLTR